MMSGLICPACSRDNPLSNEHCLTCGTSLYRTCRSCGVTNRVDASFCSTCGTAQAKPPSPDQDHAGNRIVTVLFADLTNSTAVAERLEPEEWADIAGRLLAAMTESVGHFDGAVARLMGDGIVAFFGAPVAHEDDPHRAIRAGLMVVDRVASDRRTIVDRLGPGIIGDDELQVRVGINTGPVVVGPIGGSTRSEYTAMGDAVNVAARLEKAAKPATVLVSETTRRLVGSSVSVDAAQPLLLKGKAEATSGYVVLGLSGGAESGGLRPNTVGRRAEIDQVTAITTAVSGGAGTIIFVTGEAGIGKSHLMLEARTHGDGLVWLDVACFSYERNIPLGLARKVLTALEELGGSIEHSLGHVGAERREILLRVLAQVGGGSAWDDGLTPRAVAGAFHEVVVGAARSLADRGLGLMIDDLHWVDEASADLLAELLGAAEGRPIAIVCCLRPDHDSAAWRVLQQAEAKYPHLFHRVTLQSLSSDDMTELASMILDSSEDLTLASELAQRADGNPFYLEELVEEIKLSRQGGSDRSRHALPASLQSLLQARFDRLEPSTRDTLELAAVIGRVFERSLLSRLRRVDIDTDISELQRVGLVEAIDRNSLSFRHALTQEAAYQSILGRDRKRLHRLVAEAIEAEPDRPDRSSLLAIHFVAADESEKAARYCLEAGEGAAALGATAAARKFFDTGIGLRVTAEIRSRLLRGRGQLRDLQGDLDGGLEDLNEALALSRTTGDEEAEWEVLVSLGQLWAARDYGESGRHFEQALELARRSRRHDRLGRSLNRLGNWHVNAANPLLGISMHEEALAVFESSDMSSDVAATNDLLGMAHALTGQFAESRRYYGAAVESFRQSTNKSGLAGSLIGQTLGSPNYEALTEVPIISTEEGLVFTEEALGLVRALEWAAGESYALFIKAQLLACAGSLGPALGIAEHALEIAESIGHEQWRVGGLLVLGSIESDAFRGDEAIKHLEEGFRLARATGSKNWELIASAALSLSLIDAGELLRAQALAEEALEVDHAAGYLAHRTCRLAAGAAAAELGERRRSIDLLSELDPLAPAVALALGKAWSAYDPDKAVEYLRGGLMTATHWKIPILEWRIHRALAPLTDPGERNLERTNQILLGLAASFDDETSRLAMVERIPAALKL